MSKKTNKHKILNKLTGRQMETIYVSCDEMVEMVNRNYIVPAATEEEFDAVVKTIKGGWLKSKTLESKDEKYELYVSRHNNVGLLNAKDHNWLWIHDKEADKYYEYRAFFYGQFMRGIRAKMAEKKQKER